MWYLLYFVLAYSVFVDGQTCSCPEGYHPQGDNKWCYIDVDYIPCGAPNAPTCLCDDGFEPEVLGRLDDMTFRCVNANKTRQQCNNSEDIRKYVSYYLNDRSNWIHDTYKRTEKCRCPKYTTKMTTQKQTYCFNAMLPFRRVPCNYPQPPACQCDDKLQLTQWGMEDVNVKCKSLFLKLACNNDAERASYYGKVLKVNCEDDCEVDN